MQPLCERWGQSKWGLLFQRTSDFISNTQNFELGYYINSDMLVIKCGQTAVSWLHIWEDKCSIYANQSRLQFTCWLASSLIEGSENRGSLRDVRWKWKKYLPPSHLQARDAQSLNTFVKCEKGCKNLAGLLICHNLYKNCLVYEESLSLIVKTMSQHYREFGK